MTRFNQFRDNFPSFVKEGLPSFEKLIAYVFPKTGDEEEVDILLRYPWLNRIAIWAPYIALFFTVMLVVWPLFVLFVYDHRNSTLATIFILNCICALYIGGNLLKFFVFAAFLKWKKRSSKLLLLLTLIPVYRVLPFILVSTGLYLVMAFFMRSELIGKVDYSCFTTKTYLASSDLSVPFHHKASKKAPLNKVKANIGWE